MNYVSSFLGVGTGEHKMGLKKLAEKVADYKERLESGKAHKIKPGHVEAVLQKLRSKEVALQTEISEARSADNKARLENKLQVARTHIERAEWLLKELSG